MQSTHIRCALALYCTAAMCGPASADRLESLVPEVGGAVKPDRAMETMRTVYSTDRWFTFPKFHETVRYLGKRLQSLGMRDVELLGAPADGMTQAGYWTMPLAWDAKSATLELIAPQPADEFRLLADYKSIPTSLGMWSGPTPPGGVEAEVVAAEKLEDLDRLDVAGKLVLTSQNPAGWKWKLAQRKALGAINTFTENRDLRDGRQWINAWGDHGWAYIKTSTPLLCFSITPRQSEYLRGLLSKGSVRVRAEVDSRYYADKYPYVTARIRGTGEEEVLTLGHIAEQGAHDNATGVAAMVEALSAIQDLIRAGKIPRPRRSIRVLLMPELYGSMHYVETHRDRMRRTVAAMCVDTPAASYDFQGTEYTFYMNPRSASSYTDALVLRVAGLWLGKLSPPRSFHHKGFMSGTDTYLAEPMVGVPTVWPYSGTGPITHHNSEDKPETVDPRSLRDLAAITASYLYAIASSDNPSAEFGSFAAPTISVKPSTAPAPPPEAERIVVKRKRFGTIPLDDLAVDQREGFPSGAWDNTAILSLYWCDGKRSLAEVIRKAREEIGASADKFDFVGYYRFLARKGYVEITER